MSNESLRVKGHGFRDHGGPREQMLYYCRCGAEEGNSPTLPEARVVHQEHLKDALPFSRPLTGRLARLEAEYQARH